jgi:small subunit ribosomal protein S1
MKTPVGKFQVGDIISAKVININPKERRIGLSIKQLETDEEHDLVVDYLNTYKGTESSFGELLKDNLQEKAIDQELAEEVSKITDDEGEASEMEVASEETGEEKTEQAAESLPQEVEKPEAAEESAQMADNKGEASEMEVTSDETGEEKTEEIPLAEIEETVESVSQEAAEPEPAEEENNKEV